VGLAQVLGPLAKAPIADGRLQPLLTSFATTTPGVFLYYPGKRQVLPKLRAFIEHVRCWRDSALDRRPAECEGRCHDLLTDLDHLPTVTGDGLGRPSAYVLASWAFRDVAARGCAPR